jgi:hypothetical protein
VCACREPVGAPRTTVESDCGEKDEERFLTCFEMTRFCSRGEAPRNCTPNPYRDRADMGFSNAEPYKADPMGDRSELHE